MDTPNLPTPSTATAGLPWQPPSFARARQDSRFGPDGFSVARTWEIDGEATEQAIEDAKRWLIDMSPLIRPAGDGLVKRWLTTLAMQTAGKGATVADSQMKAAAYAMSLADEPAFYFTSTTLKASARHFQWFPSVAELLAFLETELSDQRGQLKVAQRLARVTVLRPPTPKGEAPAPITMAERIENLAAAKRMFNIRPEQSLAAVVTADVPQARAEERKAQYIWIMPNGSRRLAPERPEGGLSLVEMQMKRDGHA